MRAKKVRRMPKYLDDETSILAELEMLIEGRRLTVKTCWTVEHRTQRDMALTIYVIHFMKQNPYLAMGRQ